MEQGAAAGGVVGGGHKGLNWFTSAFIGARAEENHRCRIVSENRVPFPTSPKGPENMEKLQKNDPVETKRSNPFRARKRHWANPVGNVADCGSHFGSGIVSYQRVRNC